MTWIVRAIAGGLLKPFMVLGEKYLENQQDRQRLQHGTDRIIYEADAAVRTIRLGHWMGRLPLFGAEAAASVYFIAILVDSTWPMAWLTPLELPEWFKPHFYVAMASIFGIATVDRWLRR